MGRESKLVGPEGPSGVWTPFGTIFGNFELFWAFLRQKQKTRGQTRTLDSSQRDVPVCVAFLQGVLTVPVVCLAK